MIAISSVLKTFVSASVALSWQSDTAQCKSSVNVADTWLTSLMALQILLELAGQTNQKCSLALSWCILQVVGNHTALRCRL